MFKTKISVPLCNYFVVVCTFVRATLSPVIRVKLPKQEFEQIRIFFVGDTYYLFFV